MRTAIAIITPKIPAHAPFPKLSGLSRNTWVNEMADATAAPPIADVKYSSFSQRPPYAPSSSEPQNHSVSIANRTSHSPKCRKQYVASCHTSPRATSEG